MNLNEMQRVTTPSLPMKGDSLAAIIDKTANALKELFKRDSDKEQRLRKIDDTRGAGISLNTAANNFFPLNINYRQVNANTTALPTDNRIEVMTPGVTVTLYDPTGHAGLNVTIDNNSGGNIFVTSPQLIHGVATQTVADQNVMGIFCTGTTFRLGGI